MLSQRLKQGWSYKKWSDAGGKVEEGEPLIQAMQREFQEETGIYLPQNQFQFVDCFIFASRRIKTYIFEIKLPLYFFKNIKNMEPTKQEKWMLFTVKEALKLDLLPSVRHYLENR